MMSPCWRFYICKKKIHFRKCYVTFRCVFTDFLLTFHVSGCCVVLPFCCCYTQRKSASVVGVSHAGQSASSYLDYTADDWLMRCHLLKEKKKFSYKMEKIKTIDWFKCDDLGFFLLRDKYFMWVRRALSGVVCHWVIGEGGGEWEWSNKL